MKLTKFILVFRKYIFFYTLNDLGWQQVARSYKGLFFHYDEDPQTNLHQIDRLFLTRTFLNNNNTFLYGALQGSNVPFASKSEAENTDINIQENSWLSFKFSWDFESCIKKIKNRRMNQVRLNIINFNATDLMAYMECYECLIST